MKVKITNKQAIETINVLAGMMNKELPCKMAFAIGKNMDNLQTQIYKPYERELKKIKKTYEVMDEQGQQRTDEHGHLLYTDREAYENELTELLEVENEFDMHVIKEDVLEKCENEEKWSGLTVAEKIIFMRMLEG